MTDLEEVPEGNGAGVLPVPVAFRGDREVPKDWERRLREAFPISETHSWPALRWHGEFDRLVVYECVPNQFIEQSFRSELEGAHPDTLQDWARIVSAYQWRMFREHKVHARPCWIIQGTKGGHKVEFDEIDKELCRAEGLPPEPPKPGDLPFAPFDERVVQQLIRTSKLVKAKNDLQEFKRKYGNVQEHKRTYRNALQDARKQYVAYIESQFEDGDEFFKDAYRKGELTDAPRTDDDFVEKNEKADEKYIETGRF